MLGWLVEPALADLAAQLRSAAASLSATERAAICAGTATALRETVWRKVSRVVVLELHAARLTGKLTAGDSRARWEEWVSSLERPGAWEALAGPYPALLPRLRTVIGNRCAAALTLARRFGRDRPALAALLGSEPGELAEVSFGAGDSHEGGQTVTILRTGAGPLVYKPRSVGVDAVLGGLLPRLLPAEPAATRIRVPAVVRRDDQRGGYGWTEHVAHRYCDGDGELRAFYRGLGHWLAVMRLLSGSDLHSENVVACGPVPVVVDCETLFTPHRPGRVSGYGAAVDRADERLDRSVLRTGLLPRRRAVLGFRGVDPSAAGSLPAQQPAVQVPVVIDQGTDRARVGLTPAVPQPGRNHPSPEPDLGRFWEEVVDGFAGLTAQLRRRDRAGQLAPLLAGFADCPVRVVLRDTAGYAELGRMLWYPGALHEPEPARQRAAELLARQAKNRTAAPDDPAVIDAEVAELLDGDIPVFVTVPRSGELAGPRGTHWGVAEDLVAAAVDRWRGGDLDTDTGIVKATLIAAYLNDGAFPPPERRPATRLRTAGDLDRRRRAQAADILRRMCRTAVRGDDGTATWVAPVLDPTGYAVRPMAPDLYGGLSGVAVVLAGYLQEVSHDRADEVPGLADLLAAVLRTLRLADDQQAADLADTSEAHIRVRPDVPGGYLGLGSRIWGWLLLHRLGAVAATEALPRAGALAARLPDSVAVDDNHDLLSGVAGAVVPLLRLAEESGQDRWRRLALAIGERLQGQAKHSGAGACWPSPQFPDGIGGLSHGVTGVGWALARLAIATGADRLREVAEAGFAWEEALYDPQRGGWRDNRDPDADRMPAAWCHGSVGIGVCAADLLAADGATPGAGARWRDTLARAARATWPSGFGWHRSLCHGDLGAWEVLDRAWAVGVGPPGLAREELAAQIVSGLEAHGPANGPSADGFQPGLFVGAGGVAYQLLRMHPDCRLPSLALPDPGGR